MQLRVRAMVTDSNRLGLGLELGLVHFQLFLLVLVLDSDFVIGTAFFGLMTWNSKSFIHICIVYECRSLHICLDTFTAFILGSQRKTEQHKCYYMYACTGGTEFNIVNIQLLNTQTGLHYHDYQQTMNMLIKTTYDKTR